MTDQLYGLSDFQKGRELFDQGDFPAALKTLKESAKSLPHFKTFELVGECLLNMEKPKEATLYLAAALGLGNKQPRPYLLLARALLDLGDTHAARVKLEELLSLNPSSKKARELLDTIA